jgi:predicted AAA+ superfamily ATPase
MAELQPGATSFVDRLFGGEPPSRRTTGRSREDLVADVLRGGYPIAVGLPEPARGRWFANLAMLVVERVADDIAPVWSDTVVEPSHYRTTDGVEVDLVLEAADGRVAAVEVKASASVSSGAPRGLRQLRDRLGSRFVAGLVLTAGKQAQRIDDRIAVAPVDELWTGSSGPADGGPDGWS